LPSGSARTTNDGASVSSTTRPPLVYGELRIGATGSNTATPVQVSGLTGVTAVAGGYYNGYAVRGDGTVWAWGSNRDGQLGNGTTTDSSTPVQVSGLTGVTAVAGDWPAQLVPDLAGPVQAAPDVPAPGDRESQQRQYLDDHAARTPP
jgi:hypothetical protein